MVRTSGPALRLYLAGVVGLSALLLGISAYDIVFDDSADQLLLLLGLCFLIGLSTVRLVELRPGARISAHAAPQFAAAVLLSPAAAILVTGLGISAGYLVQLSRGRHNRTDLFFNASQAVLSTWITAGLYHLVLAAGGAAAEPLALFAAAAGMYATNTFLVSLAIVLANQGRGVIATWNNLLRHDPLVYCALLVSGLFAILLVRDQNFWAVPLLIVPIALTEHVVINQREHSERDRKMAVMEQVDIHRREFVASITHDLRTPLTTIKGFGELLADREDELLPDERNAVNGINASAEQLGEMIETLLQLSELDAGMIKFEPQPSHVPALIERVFGHLHYSASIKQVVLKAEIGSPLPPVWLDPPRFEQVLANVVGNAVKFSPPGSTVVVDVAGSDTLLVIRVIDAGVGIEPDALPHIFERFFRAGNGEAGRHRTGGLGLSIAQSIVELHGGEIAAQSTPQKGTTITIRLPLRARLPDQDQAAAQPRQS